MPLAQLTPKQARFKVTCMLSSRSQNCCCCSMACNACCMPTASGVRRPRTWC